jgi:hypothetical protein
VTPRQLRDAILTSSTRTVETDFFGSLVENPVVEMKPKFAPDRICLVDPEKDVVMPAAAPLKADPVMREKILRYEEELARLPNIGLPLRHFFTEGIYMRECYIAAGVAFVGQIHRHPCLNIIAYGEVEVATEEGPKHLVGPLTWESPPRSKRIGLALKDTLWTTIHANPTNERDLAKIEAMLVIASYDAPELLEVKP